MTLGTFILWICPRTQTPGGRDRPSAAGSYTLQLRAMGPTKAMSG